MEGLIHSVFLYSVLYYTARYAVKLDTPFHKVIPVQCDGHMHVVGVQGCGWVTIATEGGWRTLRRRDSLQPPVHLNLDLRDNVQILSFFVNIRHCGF